MATLTRRKLLRKLKKQKARLNVEPEAVILQDTQPGNASNRECMLRRRLPVDGTLLGRSAIA